MSSRRRPRRPDDDDEKRDGAVWVESGVTPDGTYVVEINSAGDWATILDRDGALAYVVTAYDAAARAEYDAAARAEYDAAVLRQLTSLGIGLRDVGPLVADLRADRPPLNDAATAPLRFTPLVNAKRVPLVDVHVRYGAEHRPLTQWSPDEVRQHAGHVLDCLATADLDAGYRRILVGSVGIDDNRARAVVGTLAEHRTSRP